MRGGAVARRYAVAIFELAKEHGTLTRWLDDLAVVAQTLRRPDFQAFAENPKVGFEQKEQLLRRLLADVNPLALNLALLLLKKDRLDIVDDILAEYRDLYNDDQGIAVAKVTTAVELSPQEAETLRERLAAQTGKQIVLETEVKPEIIGGVIVRLGDRVLDASVRTRLQALRQQLVSAGRL